MKHKANYDTTCTCGRVFPSLRALDAHVVEQGRRQARAAAQAAQAAQLYSPAEYAKRIGVTPETVRRWARAGTLQSVKLGSLVRIVGASPPDGPADQ